MEDPVSTVIVGVGSTNYTNHRQVFTVSSGESVEHTESTDGEGHHTSSHAFGSSVAIGRVACVELVISADQVQLRLGDQVV
jgi:hypothetical protein